MPLKTAKGTLIIAFLLSAQVPSHAIYSAGRVLTLEACDQRLNITPYPPALSGSLILAIYDQCFPIIYSERLVSERLTITTPTGNRASIPSTYLITAAPTVGRTSILPTYVGFQLPPADLAVYPQGNAAVFSRWCYDGQRWASCWRLRPAPVTTR